MRRELTECIRRVSRERRACAYELVLCVTYVRPLTYTYLDCLLGVKMRGHKMAEIWEWLLMGSTADQYQDRPAGLLLWFVLVCRVMPRSLMFQDKLQLYKAKSSICNSCFFILLYVYWKMEFNLFRFSTIIYRLASYCKWFYWTKVDYALRLP